MAKEEHEICVGNITSRVVLVQKDSHDFNLIILVRNGSGSLELRGSDIPKAILALSKTYEYLTLSDAKGTISQGALLKE
jgi:hypothetical protein